MNIVLRKKDSVISIILFLFNIYSENSKLYSISLSNLIKFMQQFDKNETSTRMGLSRMVSAGLLKNAKRGEQVIYQLTQFGKDNIGSWNSNITKFYERYRKRSEKWNNNWYSIIMPDFNKSDRDNQDIVNALNDIGLRELSKSIWISPYAVTNEISELSKKTKFKYIELHEGRLDCSFPFKEFLNDTFGIEKLRESYSEFINILEESKAEIKAAESVNRYYLPLLFKLGWWFYEIVSFDPVLPKELLGNWVGDTAVKEFERIRVELVEKITDYFNNSDY